MLEWILDTYVEYKNWIDLIRDIVFFAGAYAFFHGAFVLYFDKCP